MNPKAKLLFAATSLGVVAIAITMLIAPPSPEDLADKNAVPRNGNMANALSASRSGEMHDRDVSPANHAFDEAGNAIGIEDGHRAIAIAVPQDGESDVDKRWDHHSPGERMEFLSAQFEGAVASLKRGSPNWGDVAHAGDALTAIRAEMYATPEGKAAHQALEARYEQTLDDIKDKLPARTHYAQEDTSP